MQGRAVVWLCVFTGCIDADRPGPADNPVYVFDASGAGFEWNCDQTGCTAVPDVGAPLPPCESGRVPIYTFAAARFVTVMAACRDTNDWYSYGFWERPVSCEVNADCPQLYEFPKVAGFECRNKLCQNIDHESYPVMTVDRLETYTLCYAPLSRGETLAPFSAASATVSGLVDQACGSGTCTLPLPDACRQP